MPAIKDMLTILLYVLIYPGFLFAGVAGLFLAGLDRKVLARMQRRVGPPLIQPLYDFLKLLGKETIIPHNANKLAYLGAPVIGTVSLSIMILFIPLCGMTVTRFNGTADLIVLLYLLTIPGVAMIIGGAASGSPFAGVGISREMVTMMAYELPLILVFLAVAKKVGGGSLCFSLGEIAAWQGENGCLLFHWSMIPAALALLLVIPAEVGTQPFDVAEAETEICEGPLVEYSGAPLALFKLNGSLKMFVMTALFTALFLGGIRLGNAAFLSGLVVLAIAAVITLISMTLLHAVCARLKIEHLLKFYWTAVSGLALISLVLAWFGL